MSDHRLLAFPVVWRVLWPLRQYLRLSPLERGKGLLTRLFLTPFMPLPPASFVAYLPGGARIALEYRETLGLITLLHGGFELAETRRLCTGVKPGTCVIDVGANVGVFTVSLGSALRSSGTAWAFEPLPSNVERLKQNIRLNDLGNVTVYPLALGNRKGEVIFHLSDDPAFHSIVAVAPRRDSGRTVKVRIDRLDNIWHEAGCPPVSLIKIDVEGAELQVLEGAQDLILRNKPDLLLEANSPDHLATLVNWLAPRGYTYFQPPGFTSWNYLFTAGEPAPRSREPLRLFNFR
jgi:FkbM family methyltransferase